MSAIKTKIQQTIKTMGSSIPYASGGAKFAPYGAVNDQERRADSPLEVVKGTRRGRKRWKVRHPLHELRLKQRLTLEELADQTDLSPSYLSRLENGNRRLNADIMQKLATALSCHPGELLPYNASLPSEVAAVRTYTQIEETSHQPINPDLPLYSPSYDNGLYTLNFNQPNDWMLRSSELFNVHKAFALKVPDDSMLPRFCAGERLLAHPAKPLSPQCSCVVVMDNQYALIGKFVGWRSSQEGQGGPVEVKEDDLLVLETFNTTRLSEQHLLKIDAQQKQDNILIPRRKISNLCRIIGMMEAA